MISADRNALICDLAETYGIYGLTAVPASLLAALAAGLRDDSRIKTIIRQKNKSEPYIETNTMLLAMIFDALNLITWSGTEAGRKNQDRPKLVTDMLRGVSNDSNDKKDSKDAVAFDSSADFRAAWSKMGGGVCGN